VECQGHLIEGSEFCLSHSSDFEKSQFLSRLSPGDDLNLRGTHFTEELLDQLIDCMRSPSSGRITLGEVDFEEAIFEGQVDLAHAHFTKTADFTNAVFVKSALFNDTFFDDDTYFEGVMFQDRAPFGRAQFAADAVFSGAIFCDGAGFGNAAFSARAWFRGVRIEKVAYFADARFAGNIDFDGVAISGLADFSGCRFEQAEQLGPIVCKNKIDLSSALFDVPVVIEAAASEVNCRRVRWNSKATLRTRYATIDLTDAFFEYPLAITHRVEPFLTHHGEVVDESALLHGRAQRSSLASLGGVDTAHVLVAGIDLSACRFSGSFHLDQIQIERGDFAASPKGFRRKGLRIIKWTKRRTLIEEHHWRASVNPGIGVTANGWQRAAEGSEIASPATLAVLYRQLRKALEDGKNEPDAADFYYGEMEMRRRDSTRPLGERFLLAFYWMISGYGLRAGRAVAWLFTAATVTLLALTLWGIPKDSPESAIAGEIANGRIILKTKKDEPINPKGPLPKRIDGVRLEKSLSVTLNSVVFRSSGHDLTTTGSYIEMASRLVEPVFLGFAVLAIRGRVKR
jgi:uncharacterized protein YjbI with pentapeptide repeats